MMIIAVSTSEKSEKEITIVRELFKNGLDIFHLRKFNCSGKDIEKYIQQIPQMYWSKIVLHSHHRFFLKYGLKGIHISERHKRKKFITWLRILYYRYKRPALTVSTSFRSLIKLSKSDRNYSYVFLNAPVDLSMENKGIVTFERHRLEEILKKTACPVFAIGGVRFDNIEHFYKMGFEGICLKGALWNSPDPVESFMKIKQKCNEIEDQTTESTKHHALK
jgi:thiamine-phosphate pyrophosphorylase